MENKKEFRLRFYQIALMYMSTLMGAGFSSGKEMWQFFGVFGLEGLKGIAVASAFLFTFGYFSVANAKMLGSAEFGKLVCPVDNLRITTAIGGIMSIFLWMAYLSMVSAGGALLEEQFGVHHALGSVVYMALAVWTAINGFEVVSKRLQKVTPILVVGTLVICMYLLIRDGHKIDGVVDAEKSPLAQSWLSSSLAFVTYNLTAAVPILGNCQRHSDWKQAKLGAFTGAAALTVVILLLYLTTQTNPEVAQSVSLPMLGFARELSLKLGYIYAFVLLIAIFGAATVCLYGVTTVLPQKNRKRYVYVIALAGYGLSLFGFNNLVAILYPIGGYFSMIFFAMMAVNFFRLKNREKHQKTV